MRNSKKTIQLIIASEHFLFRLGIKTMLSVIDIDVELIEINSLEELKSIQLDSSQSRYIIICYDILSNPAYNCILDLQNNNWKLLLISGHKDHNYSDVINIFSTDSQKEILSKFQDFFFEPTSNAKVSVSKLLSNREVDVLKAVAIGLSNKEIAEKLFISINTVVTHRKNITDKLGIKTIAGLTVYALMNNFIKPAEVQK